MAYEFINPYTFISLGEECTRNTQSEGNITGYLNCILTTKTPLIMLDTNSGDKEKITRMVNGEPKEEDHKYFKEVFQMNGKPAIPGSELRGMIRSKFEILTNSCLSAVKLDQEFTGRSKFPLKKAGLLVKENDTWKLYKADKYEYVSGLYNNKTGSKIPISFVNGNTYHPGLRQKVEVQKARFSRDSTIKGYLKIAEPLGKNQPKKHIFIKRDCIVAEGNHLIRQYEDITALFKDNLGHEHIGATSSEVRPVWYEEINGDVYFSLSQTGQLRYRNKLKDVIPSGDKTFKGVAGLLIKEEDTWKLYRAQCYCYNDDVGNKTGDTVNFNNKGNCAVFDDRSSKKGYLMLGKESDGEGNRFLFQKTTKEISHNPGLEKQYEDMVRLFSEKENHPGYTKGDVKPVWYKESPEGVYLSLSQTKLPKSGYEPCDGSMGLCEACTLFGTVNEENSFSHSSKIRVTDGTLIPKKETAVVDKPIIVELGEPKPTNIDFYFKKNVANGGFWSVDYHFDRDMSQQINDNVVIRGRKVYWHNPTTKTVKEESQMNTTINKHIARNQEFKFKVYFENITQEQLDHLIWAVSLGDKKKNNYCHQLGLGKPLGFGSVKVDITEVYLLNVCFEDGRIKRTSKDTFTSYRYLTLSKDTFPLSNQQIKEIQRVFDFYYIRNMNPKVPVDYPRLEENGPIFDWFGPNNTKKSELPFASDDSITQIGEVREQRR